MTANHSRHTAAAADRQGAAAEHAPDIASANWHATAALVGRHLDAALLVGRVLILHHLGDRAVRIQAGAQAVATFSQVVRPPWARGTTWSKVRSPFDPQYWQQNSSRRKRLKRVNATRFLGFT